MAPRKAAPKATGGVVPDVTVSADVPPAGLDAEPAWLGKVRDKLTQADQEEINGRRLGNDEAIRAAAKRQNALERSSVPPQRRSSRQGRTEA